MTDAPSSRPALDWRVPLWGVITLAIAAMGQAGAAVSYEARLEQRLQTVETQQADLAHVADQVGRIDERTLQMQKTLDRLDARQ